MRVEIHSRLKKPIVADATRVLILSDDGTPITFTVEIAPGNWRSFRVGDADFQEQLINHGIHKMVIEEVLDPTTLKVKRQ